MSETRGTGPLLFLTQEEVENHKIDFFEFDSKEYDQTVPSCSYLIEVVVAIMESDATYKMRQMQMVDGKHLSGDHSFSCSQNELLQMAEKSLQHCIPL